MPGTPVASHVRPAPMDTKENSPALQAPANFAPGASPFHAKGLVYGGAREYWDQRVPGGVAAVAHAVAATGDANLAGFLATKFVPSGLYDVLPIAPLSAVAARLSGVPHAQLVRDNAAWLAERDLRGVYRVILAVASIESVAMRLGKLSMQYFDFGRAETVPVREKVVESRRFGIPAVLAPWFIFAADGFVPVALKLAGAKSVRLRHGSPAPDGSAHGVPLVQIRFEIAWSDRPE
jgi:hypothetical protein